MKAKQKTWPLALLLSLAAGQLAAQNDRTHIGVIGGLHHSSGSYSDLDEKTFNSPSGRSGLTGGVFAEFELGSSRAFSLRPELMFTTRGLEINDIDGTFQVYNTSTTFRDVVDYSLKANYIDLRLPVAYNFGKPGGVRPFVYVAPVLGFATGGTISAKGQQINTTIDGSKANLAATYFAGQVGAGVKIPLGSVDLGIEANYELGLTDTYGSKEKDGKATALLFYHPYNIVGTRKFSGFEVLASVSVPLSVFRGSKKPAPAPTSVYQPPVRQENTARQTFVKPCYSLDEMLRMVDNGKSVRGLTICAVEQINFEYNKSVISRKSYAYLDKLARFIINTRNVVEISGHTDSSGTMERNMQLSRERAKAVYDYLIRKGVSPKRLSYTYYGPKRPRATNNTEAGRRQNRRVEFEIK